MAVKKPLRPTKMIEAKKSSDGHSKGLVTSSSVFLSLIFLIAIFVLCLFFNLSLRSHTMFAASRHRVLSRTLKSGDLPAETLWNLHHTSEQDLPDHQRSNLKSVRELPILKSDTAGAGAGNFRRRMQEFLAAGDCETQFFMTWISPAPLFQNRVLLSLETLFNSHRNGCLIILSETMDSPAGKSILKPLSDLGFKVLAISPDLRRLFRRTPALEFYRRVQAGKIDVGSIPFAQNLSNLMRLVVLYKYGGIYLDTDFIILRNFSGLRNSIGAQSMNGKTGNWSRLNNAVLIFDKGHPLLEKFIEEFVSSFNGNRWGHNGPYLVSRVVEKVRGGRRKMEDDGGEYNFTVLPPVAFYPVDWTRMSGLFQRPKTPAHSVWARGRLAQLMNGRTYGVHLWNKQTSGLGIEEGSVIGRLVSDHCIICNNKISE